jgi:hypothetical protein
MIARSDAFASAMTIRLAHGHCGGIPSPAAMETATGRSNGPLRCFIRPISSLRAIRHAGAVKWTLAVPHSLDSSPPALRHARDLAAEPRSV